ncbi:hypothetical protein [Brachyspira sp. SAP_772]|uniref:hypothetical protein n=1 Tax=Brachyspira sp. SAP_772 TaxID=2608385 RepID=UPI0012F4CCD9|nr:hypothetical protein [Brachyspira sp. SAP_772]
MKNTLLALMLVSSLFVISCGADSTKPSDAYNFKKTEVSSGTKKASITVNTTVNVENFASAGEKVTEIVEVVDSAGKVYKAANVTKNTDGSIYQFTTTVTAPSYGSVIYKYTKTLIAPVVTRTTIATVGTSGSVNINDPLFLFEKNVISVKDASGNDIHFNYYGGPTVLIPDNITGNVTIKYQYMDIDKIIEKPTQEGTISSTTTTITLTQNDAGKTYICVVNPNSATAEYFYNIVPSTGIISLTTTTTSGNYKLWLY